MTTTIAPLPPDAEAEDWYTIDNEGLPTSVGRCVTTPNLAPHGPDVYVECTQLSDGTYDADSLVVRVNSEELSGDDARTLARSLASAAETFEQWSFLTRPKVAPIECTRWCTDGDGHPNEFTSEDQVCRGEYAALDLSLSDQSDPGQIAPFARRENGGEEYVCLHVMVGDTDVDVAMTAAECVNLANHLLKAADDIQTVEKFSTSPNGQGLTR